MVAKRYSKANNPHVLGYDSSKPTVYILDLDSNNLYRKATQDYLPYGGFQWMNQEELMLENRMNIPAEGHERCFVEGTLDYPVTLHDFHADFLLAPVKTNITYNKLSPYAQFLSDMHGLKSTLNSEKWLLTFERRSFYILQYRKFQIYVKLGMEVVAIHSSLAFHQAPFIKFYVELNSAKRAKTTNKFDADFYKLTMNSLFGKTMENPEKRTKVKLCCSQRELERM